MSNFKSSFVSTMSDERRKDIAKQVIAAMRAGDEELADSLIRQVPLDLPIARFNLDDAVKAYGKEWLEY